MARGDNVHGPCVNIEKWHLARPDPAASCFKKGSEETIARQNESINRTRETSSTGRDAHRRKYILLAMTRPYRLSNTHHQRFECFLSGIILSFPLRPKLEIAVS